MGNTAIPKILAYGYGNPGRQDDALGILLVEDIEKWARKENLSTIDVDQNYQLNIEDADKISNYDVVIFIDASINDIESFAFDPVAPDLKTEFSMHSVTPAFVVGLCEEITGRSPEVFQLQIKGFEWEFMQELSAGAVNNLNAANHFLKEYISKRIKQ